jgi:hypothetical protein
MNDNLIAAGRFANVQARLTRLYKDITTIDIFFFRYIHFYKLFATYAFECIFQILSGRMPLPLAWMLFSKVAEKRKKKERR